MCISGGIDWLKTENIYVATKTGEPPPFAHEAIETPQFSFPMYKVLEKGNPESWPEYEKGTWWVMSLSSAYVIELLARAVPKEERSGLKVLDACAAPGAKTFRLHQYGFSVLATDISSNRLRRFAENSKRLGVDIPFERQDWLSPKYKGEHFDIIVLDAPCSGLGVLRRHPEIRWRRKETDIQAHTVLQSRLLHSLYRFLKPDALLLYSVCSFFSEEGGGEHGLDLQVLSEWNVPLQECADLFQAKLFKKGGIV